MDDYPHEIPPYQIKQPSLYEKDPGSGEPQQPIVIWIAWMLLGLLLMLIQQNAFFQIHYLAQLTLATTWLAFATRVSFRFIVPAALCYLPFFFVFRSDSVIAVLMSLGMFGLPWVILRAFRLLTLDFLKQDVAGHWVTPKLAERAQISLRTIGAVCMLIALGCVFWAAADRFRFFEGFKFVVAVFVPCELLFLLGTLGRAARPLRLGMIAAAPLLLFGSIWLMSQGRANELWIIFLIAADQFVVLAVLRRAGYRIGMPRQTETEQVLQATKQPASPWDE